MAERRENAPSAATPESGGTEVESASTADARIVELEEELRLKSEEAAANLDRYVRSIAEGDNFKKRLQKDKADAIRFANESLVRELLPVIDSLEAALEHAGGGGDGSSVVEGVQLTLRMFRDILERQGVKPLPDPTGAPFDPATQEAAELATSAEYPPNTVIRGRAKGYRYNDRLLRPARVVVSAGAGRSEGSEPAQ